MKKYLSLAALLAAFIAIASCTKEASGISAVTGSATNITAIGADISGKANISGKISSDLSFGVLYSTSSEVTVSSATKIKATAYDANYNFTVKADGLESGTTYYYRSYVTKGEDIHYGEVLSFTTLGGGSSLSAVDMGLSVLWANCNIGALNPEESGKYFAWGDVSGQTWNDSSWSGGGFSSQPAYEVDSENHLKPAYDAAHVNLGGKWRMPTSAEFNELKTNCKVTWTNDYNGTGVAGRIFTSQKAGYTDKSIFLPAVGRGDGSELKGNGTYGCCWSSSRFLDYDSSALCLYIDSGYVDPYFYYSSKYGMPVRPVFVEVVHVTSVSLNESSLTLNEGDSFTLIPSITPVDAADKSVTWKSADEEVATVSSEGVVKALKAGLTEVTVKTVDGNKTAICRIEVTEPEFVD